MTLHSALDALFDSVEIDVDLTRAYAQYDSDGPPESVLTDAQRATIAALVQAGQETLSHVGAHFDDTVRPHLEWGTIRITTEEAAGLAFVELTGLYTGRENDYLAEHGVGAVLHGIEVVGHGERGLTWPRRGKRPARPPVRAHPDARILSVAQALEWVERGDLRGLRDAIRSHDAVEGGWAGLAADIEAWLWDRPPLEAAKLARPLAPFLKHGGRIVEEDDLSRPLVVLRALVDAKAIALPDNPLAKTRDPERARRWVAIGAKLDPALATDEQRPLWVHRDDPAMCDALLALGASPRGLVDDLGHPYAPLRSEVLEVLWTHHPELRPDDASTQPVEVLDLWLRLDWIELSDDANPAAVEHDLVEFLRAGGPADTVVDRLLAIAGVEEVYVSDDDLERFLAAW